MANRVTQEFDAERKMSGANHSEKCRAVYKIVSDLTDIAVACGADEKFIEETYKPLANAVRDEAQGVCKS
jgi:hypothetical protein